MNEAVLLEIQNGVGVLMLNRPEKFNCLSSEVVAAFNKHLDTCATNRDVRALVIAANGKNFCTGADLDEVLGARAERQKLELFIGNGHKLLRRFEALDLPVIAGVQGLALAGGMELMMAADVTFADPAAKIACQHARYGLVPGWGGTQRLPRRIGLNRALELMVSGRWLEATEAKDWGLVNQISEAGKVRDAAIAFAADLAKKSRSGLAAMKRLARQGMDKTLDAGLTLEEHDVIDALLSADVDEGLAAFQQRRAPNFP
ncbi:MAG: enoyl-CoA hydratase/isomerase family protein [Rhodospirillales bacterium]